MQRALWDPVAPDRLGSLSDALQYRVNGEVYRFSSRLTLHQFQRTPTRWCGLLRDPVTGRRFLPSSLSPKLDWSGGPYYFASESSRASFVANPGRFQVIRRM